MSTPTPFPKIHYSTNASHFLRYLRFFHNLVCVLCAYFCPTYIEGGVLSSIYGIDSICRYLLHFWSIFITFVGFITFLVNYCNSVHVGSRLVFFLSVVGDFLSRFVGIQYIFFALCRW